LWKRVGREKEEHKKKGGLVRGDFSHKGPTEKDVKMNSKGKFLRPGKRTPYARKKQMGDGERGRGRKTW